jgi:hypothetical protein
LEARSTVHDFLLIAAGGIVRAISRQCCRIAASLHLFRRVRQASGMDTRGELKPESCEYVGADEVRVTLKTKTGDNVTYTLTAAMLHSVNLSVALINSCTAQVFRDPPQRARRNTPIAARV